MAFILGKMPYIGKNWSRRCYSAQGGYVCGLLFLPLLVVRCFPAPQVIFALLLHVFTHKNSKNFGPILAQKCVILPQGCDFSPATAKPLALFCKEKCQRALGPRRSWVLEAARTSRASHPLSCAVKGGYKKIFRTTVQKITWTLGNISDPSVNLPSVEDQMQNKIQLEILQRTDA